MQKGYLIIDVYLNTIGEPVEDAEVTISGINYEHTFRTDMNGQTSTIELNAPNKEFSLIPQNKVKPYSTYNVKVSKNGLNTVIIKNVEVFSEETSIQKVFLHKVSKTEIIDLPEHCLWDDCPSKIPENPIKSDNNNELRVLPRVIIPEYILVKNGTPTSNASILVVPFIDYIKNVASSEIYSTWHVEAIKANVHAIVSFTLNRIFTEWYPSKGNNFTISASPAYDQKFTPDRTIFQTISDVVDEYFKYYIRLNGFTQPFFAQYNDGEKTNNAGWLSQWGSQSLATQGYKAIDILKHYYTSNLGLYNAEEIIGLPNSFPGYSLQIGSCGAYVQKVQTELNRIRANYPGIPAISPANGQYNENTANAVRTFQKVFGLTQNGIVDWATWFKISYVFTAVAKLQSGV